MIETRAPGKLYIAGEYAVVEPGHPAILVAVDRYLTVRLTEAIGRGRVHSSRYGHGPVTWVRDADGDTIVVDHSPFDYVTAAITLLERLRSERGLSPRYFDLHIDSELDDSSGRKFGLGSSAAVTVAVIDALNRFYELGLSPMERFRLALLATIHVAPRASGGDLAASTFGGWIAYTAPDRARLLALSDALSVQEVLEAPEWDVCTVRPLRDLGSLRLLVGWTGSPASTERLVDRVRMSEDELDAHYARFLADSRSAVEELVSVWDEDPAAMLGIVRRCRRLLQKLGRLRGTTIETDQLRFLCDLAEAQGAAGKPSGAGGGDCGIMLLPPRVVDDEVLTSWRENDILRLELRPHLCDEAMAR
ncbi:phosphomevalonate kinase [Brachybacterium endophyticum]|uniref:Phosphomevalonate kinase n=1 Tax=Brachybacterium endophyticum TaxID=2182385 RepID=A0A2U2RHD3_9MICO|nr:phosphomevalonate kinase [Brachybacterium endophyticum]PWH05282.1 phosphomevalonate kinase [Brachybacterium endophyticum]